MVVLGGIIFRSVHRQLVHHKLVVDEIVDEPQSARFIDSWSIISWWWTRLWMSHNPLGSSTAGGVRDSINIVHTHRGTHHHATRGIFMTRFFPGRWVPLLLGLELSMRQPGT